MAEITKVPLTDVKASTPTHSSAANDSTASRSTTAAPSTTGTTKASASAKPASAPAKKKSGSSAAKRSSKPAAAKSSTASGTKAKATASKSTATKRPAAKAKSPAKASTSRPAASKSNGAKSSSARSASTAKRPAQSSTLRRVEASSSQAARDAIRAGGVDSLKSFSKTSEAAPKVVKMHADSMKDIMSKNAEDSRNAQSRLFDYTRRNAAEFARSAEKATSSVNDAITHGRGTLEACIESTNVTADMTQTLTNEMFRYANEAFSNQVEYSKDMLACRTVNDLFDLQSKMVRAGIDSLFNQSLRLSDMMFEYATEASEPLSQHAADAAKRFATSSKR